MRNRNAGKSRKVKRTVKSNAFLSKKKLQGNVALDSDGVDSDASFREDVESDPEISTDEDEDNLIRKDEDISEEEEVLPITDDDDDDMGGKEESGLPIENWGKKKYKFYSADFVDEDRGRSYRVDDAEEAKAEQEEGLAIKRSITSFVLRDKSEFQQLNIVEDKPDEESEEEGRFELLPQQDKIKLLKKKYPELLAYRNEFKEKINEIRDRLCPLLELFNAGNYPNETTKKYIEGKYSLYLQYLMNISFYFYLKSKGKLDPNHPVKQRIADFKQVLDRINDVPDGVNEALDNIVEKLRNNEEVKFNTAETSSEDLQPEAESIVAEKEEIISQTVATPHKLSMIKEKKSKQFDTETEKEVVSLYRGIKKQAKKTDTTDMPEEKMDEDPSVPEEEGAEGKRTITYDIAKNKGLMPKRKKSQRNPRVHNRLKFKKAQARRKGQVREVRREITRYDGEHTGISAHVVRSVKFK